MADHKEYLPPTHCKKKREKLYYLNFFMPIHPRVKTWL